MNTMLWDKRWNPLDNYKMHGYPTFSAKTHTKRASKHTAIATTGLYAGVKLQFSEPMKLRATQQKWLRLNRYRQLHCDGNNVSKRAERSSQMQCNKLFGYTC
eukprot:3865825-Pleurochrysis_carterae.AAC.1